ncbi:MAG TPA: type II toxin-antitoxin system HicA family toxin [Chloroflexota bacterium]|nr:type II toxin-antitoxin system HicA family toxin [Chloroflexota bacterium]
MQSGSISRRVLNSVSQYLKIWAPRGCALPCDEAPRCYYRPDARHLARRHGFEIVRQSGSHAVVRHAGGRWTTVPMHKGRDLAKGTLHQIPHDTRLTVEDP